jgi:ATP-dependent helicase/nuclease subunit B
VSRIFLGWDNPLIDSTADWLWECKSELPSSCLVVPTSQSGRRLREVLAKRAALDSSVLFGLRIVTPSFFLQYDNDTVASQEVELTAWIEVIEAINDWEPYLGAFPIPPKKNQSSGWAMGLAKTLAALRYELQEAGLLLHDAATKLEFTIDRERWYALVKLEKKVEALLQSWGFISRNYFLITYQAKLPADCNKLIVANVPDAVPIIFQQWLRHHTTYLIGAPESQASHFDLQGKPLISWLEKPMPYPGRDSVKGSVTLVGNTNQFAIIAARFIAEADSSPDDVALVTGNLEFADDLVREFRVYGWNIYNPGEKKSGLNWEIWLSHWRRWLMKSDLKTLTEMLNFRETEIMSKVSATSWAGALGTLRNQWLVNSFDDVKRVDADHTMRSPVGIKELILAIKNLLDWKEKFERQNFIVVIEEMIHLWKEAKIINAETEWLLTNHLHSLEKVYKSVKRDAGFWLQLFCENLPKILISPPDDRLLDVQGWLEISFDKSSHLVICGMNESFIPANDNHSPWLNENSRKLLGLITNEIRASRDAFLYQLMIQSRSLHGRVDLICAKTDEAGATLYPSRLLLMEHGEELAKRVNLLFQQPSIIHSNAPWEADWKWNIPCESINQNTNQELVISVTKFKEYIDCPFRFYLKNRLKMEAHDGDRGEWNHRDFGNVMHKVLEIWGRDTEARKFINVNDLECWLIDSLDKTVLQRYGASPGLAICLQKESLRQRLIWFAEIQAKHRAAGWIIHSSETHFSLPFAAATLRGTIDRIDVNEHTNEWQLWDYKSGQMTFSVANEHLKQMKLNPLIPAHLSAEPRMIYEPEEKNKYIWKNLQLPLYTIANLTQNFPSVGYIKMGETKDKINFEQWENFSADIVKSAQECGEFLVEKIKSNAFWPPANNVKYDNFTELAMNRELINMVNFSL